MILKGEIIRFKQNYSTVYKQDDFFFLLTPKIILFHDVRKATSIKFIIHKPAHNLNKDIKLFFKLIVFYIGVLKGKKTKG